MKRAFSTLCCLSYNIEEIFKDSNMQKTIKEIAKKNGIIVFTDSDGAGFVIRNFLKGAIDAQYLKHAYIPDVFGKETRKTKAGKEGKLGVEGMRPEVIVEALRRAGATIEGESVTASNQITKQDMVQWGLSGAENATENRKKLLKALDFPERMTCNAMLQAINLLYTKDELINILEHLE